MMVNIPGPDFIVEQNRTLCMIGIIILEYPRDPTQTQIIPLISNLIGPVNVVIDPTIKTNLNSLKDASKTRE